MDDIFEFWVPFITSRESPRKFPPEFHVELHVDFYVNFFTGLRQKLIF